MRFLTNTCAAAVFCVFGSLVSEGEVRAQEIPGDSTAGDYLTIDELWHMYHNRSWVWSDGAGYFLNTERVFMAYTGSGADAAYAEGTWFLGEQGKLCFRATWVGGDDADEELSCFSHWKDGDVIYQRPLPDGDWYVFKSDPVKSSDEIRKLLPGDYVSQGFERNKLTISRE